MTEEKLRVENLKKHFVQGGIVERIFGEQQTVRAVDGVDFSVRENETVGLIGESGSGKSTVAKTIMGIHSKTDGEILINGETLEANAIGGLPIQMIFQDPAESLNPRKTVGNILSTSLKLENKSNIESEMNRLLTEVGLEKTVKNRYAEQLSGGQQQRVAIARALASDPEILIADEPVSGLDVSIQAKILNLLQDIQEEENLSLLVISHNLGVLRSIADRVNIMYLGEIVEKGQVEDIFEFPAHPYTRALLSATQIPDPDVDSEYIPLKDDNPSSINPPSGCRFHTRCHKYIGDVCKEEHPDFHFESEDEDWDPNGDDHTSRCHLLG